MAKRKNLKKQYALPKWFWIVSGVILVIIVSSLGYFFYWRTGWADYNAAFNRCGGIEPVYASSFIASTYTLPGDKSYKVPRSNGLTSNYYFCSESDAKAAGYKHGAY